MQWDSSGRRVSRRSILRGTTAFAATSLLPSVIDRYSFALDAGAPVQANVIVGSGNAGVIPADFCGLSYEKSLLEIPFFTRQNQRAVGLFKRLGMGSLRLGGNSVDKTQWAPNGHGQTQGEVAPPDVDALASFLNATGWSTLYGVNLATSNPALAAAEVAYAAKALGNKLAGVEIGNEPDGYAGNYFAAGWDPAAQTARWQQFADAILQQTPNVALTGPGIGTLKNVNSWTASFVAASSQVKQLKQLTQHYYRADGHSPASTMDLLLSPDPALTTALKQLQALSKQHGLQFRFTEANSFYNGGRPGVSNACGSALWALDFLFQLAQGGACGVNFQDGGNFTRGYTVISHRDADIYGPQPEYYGLLLFTLAGMGTLRPVSISAGTVNATAYAVENNGGTLNIVLINKDTNQNLKAEINAGRKIGKSTAMLLTMPSLMSTEGISIQGATVGKDGSFSTKSPSILSSSGATTSIVVNAGSAALIQIT